MTTIEATCARCAGPFRYDHLSGRRRDYCFVCSPRVREITPVEDRERPGPKVGGDRARNGSGIRGKNTTLSSAVYEHLVELQGGVCAACGGRETETYGPSGGVKRLAADHNHATGKFRAMLCGACNRTLGLLGESVQRIRDLADYLEKHST